MGNQAIDSNLSNEEQGLISFLGLFVMSWSLFEQTVDRAIMHQLDITAKQAAIVVCGIGFERKVSILRSLLRENEAAHKTVSEIIARIMNNASRNVLLHATISIGNSQVDFHKMDCKTALTCKCVNHTLQSFADLVTGISDDIAKLRETLGLTEDQVQEVANIGRSLPIKPKTSPSPPSRKAA